MYWSLTDSEEAELRLLADQLAAEAPSQRDDERQAAAVLAGLVTPAGGVAIALVLEVRVSPNHDGQRARLAWTLVVVGAI